MLVAYFLPILLILKNSDGNIIIELEDNHNVKSCVTEIINKNYKRNKVTYVDINYNDSEIVKTMHSLLQKVINRKANIRLGVPNYQYIITVGTYNDLKTHFPDLLNEAFWNPYALFLIIVKTLHYEELKGIFDMLLDFHVINAIVLNGTGDAKLYTYNPFENYNCGKKYDSIIEYGKCLQLEVDDFFPHKLVTGLQKCTFNATISHWPPFAIDPKYNNSAVGSEQYALKIISEMEQFQLNFTKSVSGDEFSTVLENMTASGDLFLLQQKQTDILFGGMMLTYSRSLAFNYLWGHLPFIDDIRVLVRKAKLVQNWKYLFLEFDTTVWLVFMASFIAYFVLVLAILRVKDKTALFLIMIDLFFLHGSKKIFKTKGVFIMWVFFAYLISVYYQSSLLSIISKPNKDYQISTSEDLEENNIKPCISPSIQKYIQELRSEPVKIEHQDGCNVMLDCIKSVIDSDKKYTLTLSSIYRYNKHLFYDEYGKEKVYVFRHPLNAIIYAIYLYKGFPLYEKLNQYTIRLRENGMIETYTQNLYKERLRTFLKKKSFKKTEKTKVVFPWYILLVGYVASTGLFILELLSKKK